MGRLYGVINLMQSAFLFSNDSRTGSPCPVLQYPISVLQQEVRVFTPLSSGEGLGVGLFILVLEDGRINPMNSGINEYLCKNIGANEYLCKT